MVELIDRFFIIPFPTSPQTAAPLKEMQELLKPGSHTGLITFESPLFNCFSTFRIW